MARNALKVLGPDTDIGVRRLLRWRLQGVRQLTVVLAPQIEVSKPVVWWLSRAAREGIWRRLGRAGENLWALSRRRAISKLIDAVSAASLGREATSANVIAIDSLGRGGAEKQALRRAQALGKESGNVTILLREPLTADSRVVAADIKMFVQPSLQELVDDPAKNFALTSQQVELWRRLWALLPGDLWLSTYLAAVSLMNLRPNSVLTFLDRTNVTVGLAALLTDVESVRLSFRSVSPRNYDFYRLEWLGIYQALIRRRKCTLEANSFAGRDSYARWLQVDKKLIAYQPNDETSEFGNGGSPSKPRPSNQRSAATGHKVGWLGRFGGEKDPHLWVDVLENLNRDFPQVSGVMAGTGPLESETRDLINHQGLSNAIQILGITSGSRKFLDSVDLLLLTSRYDGRPNVVAEAASCSIPVVATSSGDLVLMEMNYKNLMVSKRRDSEVLGGMASMVALAV